MKQIIVNVSGLSVEEKQRVNEALAKISGAYKLPVVHPAAGWFFAPASSGTNTVSWGWSSTDETPTHTPQQVLEMAGMGKQGHVHANLMAMYAEDAKTTDKPWELWQTKVNFTDGHKWVSFNSEFYFNDKCEYRRKPKTHIVNGVEVPDLRFEPKKGDRFYLVDPAAPEFTCKYLATTGNCYNSKWIERGLCYEPTEEGKQAAILHAKACLGIA